MIINFDLENHIFFFEGVKNLRLPEPTECLTDFELFYLVTFNVEQRKIPAGVSQLDCFYFQYPTLSNFNSGFYLELPFNHDHLAVHWLRCFSQSWGILKVKFPRNTVGRNYHTSAFTPDSHHFVVQYPPDFHLDILIGSLFVCKRR